jgi:predicted phage terminase large subunit-like protein
LSTTTTTLRINLPRPHSAQQRIKNDARRFNILACGRRFGKTALGVDLAVEPALRGYPVGWFNPTYKLLSEVWRELKRTLQPVTRHRSETEHRIELITGGIVECWTLEDASAGRGRKYKRVILDEAAMARNLEEAWEQAIRPTLTDMIGDAWFLSTPKGYNYFHTLYQRGLSPEHPDYASWQMPSSENPYLPPSELAAAQLELPPRVFNQEYEASFVDDATMIFERSWWAGQNRFDAADQTIPYRSIGRWCSWDTAMKDKVTNAYTARIVGELMPNYQLLIRHVWRDRLTFPALPAAIQQDAELYYYEGASNKLRGIIIEDKASGTSAYQTLRASAQPWLTPLLIPFQPSGDKAQRAEQAAVWCRNGCVLLPQPSPEVPWLMDFENELFQAPLSEFMDQVDAMSQLILWVENYLAEGWHARGGIAA